MTARTTHDKQHDPNPTCLSRGKLGVVNDGSVTTTSKPRAGFRYNSGHRAIFEKRGIVSGCL